MLKYDLQFQLAVIPMKKPVRVEFEILNLISTSWDRSIFSLNHEIDNQQRTASA